MTDDEFGVAGPIPACARFCAEKGCGKRLAVMNSGAFCFACESIVQRRNLPAERKALRPPQNASERGQRTADPRPLETKRIRPLQSQSNLSNEELRLLLGRPSTDEP